MKKHIFNLTEKDIRKAGEVIDIAIHIRKLRKGKGWSQGQLAKKTGMKQSNISRLESAYYEGYSLNTVKKLAEVFGVPTSTLTQPLNSTGKKDHRDKFTFPYVAEVKKYNPQINQIDLDEAFRTFSTTSASWTKSISNDITISYAY